MRSRQALWWVAALAGGLFLLAHLNSLAWFLDDIDAINFAMGVREFDVAKHQPHPPGYPVFIALGKIARTFAGVLPGAAHGGPIEAGSLAVWGVIGGALSALSLAFLFLQVEEHRTRALAAMALTLICPLFWFTSSRPLSDVPGFAAVLLSQALAAAAFARQRGWAARQRESGGAISAGDIAASGRLIVLSALVAGLAIGLRSQTIWLTGPLIAVVVVDRAGRAAAGALLGALLTFGIGILLWFVPMLFAAGGPARYLRALTSQAGEDFTGVDMLVTSPNPGRRLVLNLLQTFVSPWVSLPLAVIILALAAIGALVMLRGSRRGLILLGGMAAPYALFHLAFQENETVRYALPLVPAVAYLTVRGMDALLRRVMPLGAAALVAACAFIAVPALTAYASETSPVFHLFDDMQQAITGGTPAPVAIGMHRRVLTESRRAREWAAAAFPWKLLPAPVGHEWLELVKVWRDQSPGPIWFVADPHRTDLALIDPASRRYFARRYRWPIREVPRDPLSRTLYRVFPAAFEDPALVGGARPDEMDWYVFETPGWFLGEGWALTPETAGVADRDKKGPGYNRAVGYVGRRLYPSHLMIGGRNLGAATDPIVRFTLALDGATIDRWDVKPAPGFYLRYVAVPPSLLLPKLRSLRPDGTTVYDPASDRWAELTVTAEAVTAEGGTVVTPAQPVQASVEQFDLQPLDGVMVAYDSGWHEAEFDPRRGLSWRWASDAATLRLWSGDRDVELRLRVESPRRYFDTAPHVVLRAGDQTLATLDPTEDFEMTARIPAAALRASGGIVTLTTDRVFVPADAQRGSQDRRRLGLRVYEVIATSPAESR